MKDIVLLDLFSGAGGFAKGLEEAGFKIKKHYFSEIDKHAIANYKYNFKNGEYVGSVTDVRGSGIDRPDIITFGSPCQDFSLAGKRSGMEGQRSVLILEAIRIISECKPSAFIWENVKGTFSSNNGADFWAIIAAFANIGGYRLEWQLLNTSWFLPQNRERIYLVGHLAGRSEPGVFPIGKNVSRINGRTKKAEAVSEVTLISSFGRNDKQKIDKKVNPINANCITSRMYKDFKENLIINSNTSKGYEIATEGDNIPYANNIRRLTEIECERLQGFPDGHTEFGMYLPAWIEKHLKKKEKFTHPDLWLKTYLNALKRFESTRLMPIPKTQRYKLMGNAVTVKVVKAVAERLTLKFKP